ncbi:MAG: DASS family sodium-coupled anion symporter, partial [Opitutales bacterium]
HWKALAPVLLVLALLLTPAPAGLALHAWRFFAIFAGVILGLVLEPLPGAVIGLIGVSLVTLFSRFAFFAPAELAQPGFDVPGKAAAWALSGFSNETVWLIFAAFLFALGYDVTGLGRRLALLLVHRMGRRTLTLGYAIMLSDVILSPGIPSNTARSGGTIFPVIRNLPPLYDSRPNDPSSRRIGGYLMWVALASCCITSSLFLTGLAPNLLALTFVTQATHHTISWMEWLRASAPFCLVLLALLPLAAYWLYPPGIKSGSTVPDWARGQLDQAGPLSRRELILLVLVLTAIASWIFGGRWISPTSTALLVVALMLICGVIRWKDVLDDGPAWNTLVWFATLVALASGLNRTGFITWFASLLSPYLAHVPPTTALVAMLGVFFVLHYLFASVTAHVTALLPVMLTVGAAIPGFPLPAAAILLCLELGIMGIISPYGTGPSPIYYGSGYIPSKDFWRLGTIFGLLFFIVFLAVGVPWVLALSR